MIKRERERSEREREREGKGVGVERTRTTTGEYGGGWAGGYRYREGGIWGGNTSAYVISAQTNRGRQRQRQRERYRQDRENTHRGWASECVSV